MDYECILERVLLCLRSVLFQFWWYMLVTANTAGKKVLKKTFIFKQSINVQVLKEHCQAGTLFLNILRLIINTFPNSPKNFQSRITHVSTKNRGYIVNEWFNGLAIELCDLHRNDGSKSWGSVQSHTTLSLSYFTKINEGYLTVTGLFQDDALHITTCEIRAPALWASEHSETQCPLKPTCPSLPLTSRSIPRI